MRDYKSHFARTFKEILMEEIRYYMEESILSINLGATAKEAAELMRKNSISSLLVGEEGSYSGFLTDTDLTRKLVAKNRDPEQTSVAAIASESVIAMDADRSMEEAYSCMIQRPSSFTMNISISSPKTGRTLLQEKL